MIQRTKIRLTPLQQLLRQQQTKAIRLAVGPTKILLAAEILLASGSLRTGHVRGASRVRMNAPLSPLI